MRWLKAYPTLLQVYWARTLEYRGQIIIWILASVLPLVMLLVWLTIAQEKGGPVGGYDQTSFISYYLAIIFARRLTGVWIIWDLDLDIRKGNLSAQLLRPLDPVHYFLVRILASRPLSVILVGPPVVVASLLLGARYDLSLLSLVLTLTAVAGALLIEFFSQMLMGALTFWISQTLALAESWFWLRNFFSGWIIPIDLFPAGVIVALLYLPFRYTLSFPVEIILGRLALTQIGRGLLIQYGWVLLFFMLYRWLWQCGLKRYSAVGA